MPMDPGRSVSPSLLYQVPIKTDKTTRRCHRTGQDVATLVTGQDNVKLPSDGTRRDAAIRRERERREWPPAEREREERVAAR